MNPNRRWIALAFFGFGILLWVLVSRLILTIMGWSGVEEYDVALLGQRFTLTTLVGLMTALIVTIYCYRHPTITVLSNEVITELKKVTWPNSRETRSATIVVIITVVIIAFFLGIFDLFWSNVMDYIYPSVQSG